MNSLHDPGSLDLLGWNLGCSLLAKHERGRDGLNARFKAPMEEGMRECV